MRISDWSSDVCSSDLAGSTTTWTPRRWTSCATIRRRRRHRPLRSPTTPQRTTSPGPTMPIDWPVLLAALLSGLTGGLHCAAMCGGIATSFPALGPRGDLRYVIEPNLGRVLGYVTAGAVAGGIGRRAEERRVAKEWGSTCRSRWAPAH